jgi:hypothetical protein
MHWRRSLSCAVITTIILVGCEKKQQKAQLLTNEGPDTVQATLINLPAQLSSKADTLAVLSAVRGSPEVGNAKFDSHTGDWDTIAPGVEGWIQPHVQAYAGGMAHGKLLARIGVTKDVADNGWKASGWNYWVLVKFTGDPSYRSLMVPSTGDQLKIISLRTDPGHLHKQAMARWNTYNKSFGTAWATCDPGTCCCAAEECYEPPPFMPPPGHPKDTVSDTLKHRP